jgi:hypothetical protein
MKSGFRIVRRVVQIIKNILFRKSFREITFVSGTTTWRECFIILSMLLKREDLVEGVDIVSKILFYKRIHEPSH